MLLTWAQTPLYAAILGLFSSGANGCFLDANDWGPTGTGGTGVVFQDAEGTSPVTAMEQPVGLILDKSQGLVLGSELIVNGSNPTTTTGWTPNAGSTLTVVANKFRVQGQESYQAYATVVGALYKCSVDIAVVNPGAVYVGTSPRNAANYTTGQVAASATKQFYFIATATTTYLSMLPWNAGVEYCDFNNITVKKIAGNHAYNPTGGALRPIITARYNLLLATATLSTQSVTVGAGSYTLYFTGSGSVALSGAATGTKTAGSNVITCTAGTLTLTVTGSVLTADLRPSDQATGLIPQYQRVNTSTDYDTVGFPIRETYNGANQLLTGASGGGATTGFFFCAGVMITKVGAAQTLFSDTGTNTGWRVRINASNQLELSAGNGTTYTTVATVGTVSINKLTVVTAWHDGTNLNVQINQGAVAQAAFAVATAGTAGFTIGRDNGASTNYLQGSLGEIVYRTGTAMTAAQIATTQAFVNSKQKAY